MTDLRPSGPPPAPNGSGYIVQKAQSRGVTCVELWTVDLAGRPTAVTVPVAGLEAVLEDGLSIPAAVLGEDGPELVLTPDPHTFAVPPIVRGQAVARLLCDVHDVTGLPSPLCARSALKRQLGRANALGYTFYMGATIDHRCLAAIGEARPADAAIGASIARAEADVLEAVGVAVRAFHGERGADRGDRGSHWAFDLDWVDPLTLADAVVTHRRVLRDVARAVGRDVTFMPHPWPGAARSRLDLFVSLVEGGTPSFPDALDPGGLSPAARSFGAWLEAEVQALELVMKGTVNSWTEPHPPRVMASASGRGEGGATVQVRGADSAANPYLLIALVLGAGLESSRGSAPAHGGPAATLVEAARAAEVSSLAREVLGPELLRALIARARSESATWRRQVTPWEVERYLGC